ncbi:MAG: ACP S-malonyltransferase [Planctomycetota bacterium]
MERAALLFPGQGAQNPGMGADIVQNSPAARKVFEAANEALDVELDHLCFEGTLEQLSRSDVAQPAILTVSIATLQAMTEAAGAPPDSVGAAGLSLGEYSALVAAGAVRFTDAVRLVRRRGLFMQEACERRPGTMFSIIGLEADAVEQACDRARQRSGGVWPANYNSPGQIVLSGEEEAVGLAAELCGEAGARRTVQLRVAGAFHSPLMQPAAEKLAPLVEELEVQGPAFPVPSNVTGRPADSPAEIRRLLVAQVTSPVRWLQCQQWLIDRGEQPFYEVGPGRVLRGLLRRTDRSRDCLSVNRMQDVTTYAEHTRNEDDD